LKKDVTPGFFIMKRPTILIGRQQLQERKRKKRYQTLAADSDEPTYLIKNITDNNNNKPPPEASSARNLPESPPNARRRYFGMVGIGTTIQIATTVVGFFLGDYFPGSEQEYRIAWLQKTTKSKNEYGG
jgi:hypothetical protein